MKLTETRSLELGFIRREYNNNVFFTRNSNALIPKNNIWALGTFIKGQPLVTNPILYISTEIELIDNISLISMTLQQSKF